MNILVLAPFLPRPDAPSGNPRAVFDRVSMLSRMHRLTVVSFIEPGERKGIEVLEALDIRVHGVARNPKRGLTVAHLWRKRARLAAGLFNLNRPMLVQEFNHPRMSRLVFDLVRHGKFDLIMVEHILMAQYVDRPDSLATPPIILTEHDVRLAFSQASSLKGTSGYERKSVDVRASLGFILEYVERVKWRRYAQRHCLRADAVLVPTREDAEALLEEVPGLVPQVVPFGTALAYSESGEVVPGLGDAQENLLFVGNFDHAPNVDAALWLCGEIMPIIRRERPDIDLWLVGKNPTPEVLSLARPRVTVTGEVSSVTPYLRRCTLFVAPLRKGGGMRIKLIEAMGAGAAVVTTTLGAQGLGAVSGQHLLIADDAGSFAEAVLQALDDPGLRQRLFSAGQALVNSESSAKDRLNRLNNIIQATITKAAKAQRSSV